MATGTAQLTPTRLSFLVPVPERLSEATIRETVAVAASRLHWELSALYRRERYERAEARIAARRAARVARRES